MIDINYGGKKTSYKTYQQAYKATRPNIIQRAMVRLSTMNRGARNYGTNIVRAASNRDEQLRKAGMK